MNGHRSPIGKASSNAVRSFRLLRPDSAYPSPPASELHGFAFLATMLDHQAVLVAQQNHIAGGPNNLVEMVEFCPRHFYELRRGFSRNPKFADCQNSWGFA